MFSYRHAFHAGNHADVLKHFITIQLLQYLNQKDTAYTYIDTHSGAGVYALDGTFASKNAEYDTGIGPLWERDDMPPQLKEYVDLIRAMNPSGKMRYYPGSPYIAEQVAREQDRLRLFELHPADAKLLADNFRKLEEHAAEQGIRPTVRGKRVMVTRSDGFQSLKALLPPPSRRALVLIDPPYEDKQDYKKVKDALAEALTRFPSGTYAVWYPLLQRMESRQFADKLKQLQCSEWLNVVLTTREPTPDGFGLHSSGMFILNPPYTLEPMLKQVMPYLVKALGVDSGARFTLESGTPTPVRGNGGTASLRNAAAQAPRSAGASGPRSASAQGPRAPAGQGPRGAGVRTGAGEARSGAGREGLAARARRPTPVAPRSEGATAGRTTGPRRPVNRQK
ncbi:23S rRNA (adenine(2030)-N(6))-methyltransferase RlmJ [Duganella fentianensis]|uniref:23S rRNA (adenine(2030)-N(6))-methyltransferase RlmJ n=1 Tax=Duganella fentianensis TaxID=2692177 RepID=UPI001E573126|nr:23S rRNA (adenine(2030)-N(6))-methyltransferase RlmJ [Duganella fentianensis]